jgi:hypothetical protein
MAALPAQAAGAEWDHNDSVMKLVENGKKRRFIYEQPREALKPAGVTTGTILFDGEEKEDGRLSGYAKLFRKGCDPIDYFVEGSFDRKKGVATLQGQVPIYSGEGCKITGYSEVGKASNLRFVRLGGGSDEVATIPEREKRPSYLPPASVTEAPPEEPPVEEREQTARIERDAPVEREYREPPRQRSSSRVQEEPYAEEDDYEPEGYEDDRDAEFYNWRKRRAQREGRYADEDAAYFSERRQQREDYDSRYYEDDYDEYDDGPAYYPIRPRWQRY